MDIRSELEHANLIATDKDALTNEKIKELSQEYHVLIVCDITKGSDEEERKTYVKALETAGIITAEQVDAVFADESIIIIVPFHSLQIAEQTYRLIPHATHFVKMLLDGEPYSGAC